MATATAVVNVEGKKQMLLSLTDDTGLQLVATGTSDAGPVSSTKSVDYGSPTTSGTDASVDIVSDITFTFTNTNTTISSLVLQTTTGGTVQLIQETLTTDNEFPNGGDLIVKSFKVTIT